MSGFVIVRRPVVPGMGVASKDSFGQGAAADVFDHAVLTVTYPDGAIARTYQPEQWFSATVFSSTEYPMYTHRNPQLTEGAHRGLTTTGATR